MLSYIEEHEVQEAKDFVREVFDCPLPELDGTAIAVKLYIRPDEISTITGNDGTVSKIYLPESISCHDKYMNCTALVVAIGAACENLPYRVGDWLLIPRNEGTQFYWHGTVIHLIESDRIYAAVKNPQIINKN